MHRPTALALSLILAGCSSTLPRIQHVSLKDTPAKQDVPAAIVLRNDISITTPVVIGGSEADNRRLALALTNALIEHGYDIKAGGAWRILGAFNGSIVTWTIVAPDGVTKGTVQQSNPSSPALQAIVPGVRSHLPRPSTPI